MNPLQAKIVQFLREHREAGGAEIAAAVGIGESELRRELATLRHMEVVRATKKRDEVLFTLFDGLRE
jgi:DNA-binding IclR family transcriptional regulator